MRSVRLNKKGLEFRIVVIAIFSLVLLIVLLMIAGLNIGWVNAILDKLFGGF